MFIILDHSTPRKVIYINFFNGIFKSITVPNIFLLKNILKLFYIFILIFNTSTQRHAIYICGKRKRKTDTVGVLTVVSLLEWKERQLN
jgi:hypothetical protein